MDGRTNTTSGQINPFVKMREHIHRSTYVHCTILILVCAFGGDRNRSYHEIFPGLLLGDATVAANITKLKQLKVRKCNKRWMRAESALQMVCLISTECHCATNNTAKQKAFEKKFQNDRLC